MGSLAESGGSVYVATKDSEGQAFSLSSGTGYTNPYYSASSSDSETGLHLAEYPEEGEGHGRSRSGWRLSSRQGLVYTGQYRHVLRRFRRVLETNPKGQGSQGWTPQGSQGWTPQGPQGWTRQGRASLRGGNRDLQWCQWCSYW